ncbi:T3SS (YopN, CesT) and YbjN peptide-binding chaperone 1 [Ornithinimicrobium sp. W1679]|uniref:T3SS (YopN, CesT) and YbjN peptide-binding chaperone 1 n=1 Tax=Ornithinimicrobium sp. W1679 TaxID=3418770 RepID=UPI003CF65FDD
MDEFDLDRATEVGWAGFLTRLAAHLATTAEPLRITPYGAGSESAPVLEVRPDGDVLRAELRTPGDRPPLDEEHHRHLLALGWHEEPAVPSSPSAAEHEGEDHGARGTAYLVELPRTHAHLLAAVVSDTLRQVVGAPHPAFLDAGTLTITPPDPDQAQELPQIDLDEPVRVTTPAELRQAVETTLHATMGHPPRRDADGDVPIVFGTTLVYVRTADAQPVVSIFAILVQDVADLDAASREVGILNRESVFAKFHLVGRQVVANVAIPSLPFVPRHLVGMIELMGRELDRLDDALALRVQGRRWIDVMTGKGPGGAEPVPAGDESSGDGAGDVASGEGGEDGGRENGDDGELPVELLTLLNLDPEGQERLEPALVADVCHHDRSLILRFIRIAEEQTISWRESVDEARAAGDVEEARVATGELHGWQSTVRDLRAALRHVVTFGQSEG